MWHVGKLVSVPLMFLTFDIQLEGVLKGMNSQGVSCLSALLIVAWTAMLTEVRGAGQDDVEKHMELGNKMLAAGQLADALSHYHAAVDSDPSNYKVYFRRATVYLAMGKSKSALPDLDKVIELKPDFTAARVQRGNVKLKQGRLDEAHIDYENATSYLINDTQATTAVNHMLMRHDLHGYVVSVIFDDDTYHAMVPEGLLHKDPSNADAQFGLAAIEPLKQAIEMAYVSHEDGDFQGAIEYLKDPLERCPWDADLHELRADCYERIGEFYKAISDIRPTTKLRPDNTAGYYRLSTLYYTLGEAEESLNEIRECLKLDPDHRLCFPHYKKVKKLVKQMGSILDLRNEQRWDDCLQKVEAMKKTESEEGVYQLRAKEHSCHCHSKAGHYKEAVDICTNVIETSHNNVDAYCDRAEAYILNEMFDEAIEDYKKAEEIAGEMKKVQEGLKRAQKLLKQSLKRDYYKILGVKRNANKKEILKAYRKLAMEWHPDQHPGEEEKLAAEQKFMDIAAAKEVLTDPEMRQKFDNGEDPLDAEEQASQGSHGHPFFHGFNPFGHGGGFKFHFN